MNLILIHSIHETDVLFFSLIKEVFSNCSLMSFSLITFLSISVFYIGCVYQSCPQTLLVLVSRISSSSPHIPHLMKLPTYFGIAVS